MQPEHLLQEGLAGPVTGHVHECRKGDEDEGIRSIRSADPLLEPQVRSLGPFFPSPLPPRGHKGGGFCPLFPPPPPPGEGSFPSAGPKGGGRSERGTSFSPSSPGPGIPPDPTSPPFPGADARSPRTPGSCTPASPVSANPPETPGKPPRNTASPSPRRRSSSSAPGRTLRTVYRRFPVTGRCLPPSRGGGECPRGGVRPTAGG